MAQSVFRTVIVCHFALFTIPGSQKHPRITKNHPNFGELHLNFGEFHLEISGIQHFWVDSWCHFTNSGVLFGAKIRCHKVFFAQ